MLYFVYIGNNQATISHYTQIVDGVFITTDREEKANDILSNINEQYNTVVLFEQGKDTDEDCRMIERLHEKYPQAYIVFSSCFSTSLMICLLTVCQSIGTANICVTSCFLMVLSKVSLLKSFKKTKHLPKNENQKYDAIKPKI